MKRSTDSKQPQLRRREVLLGLSFLSAAGIAAARQPTRQLDYLGDRKLDDAIPKAIGDWKFVTNSGLVVPPEDQLSRALYSQLLTRVYADGRNPPIMLLIAQSGSQTGLLQVHRPEVCYPAGGYRLSPVVPHPIPLAGGSLTANALSASANARTEHILYWTRIGDRVPSSWAEQRLAIATDNLKGIIPDAALVRISTVTNDRSAAFARMDRFAQSLLRSLPPPTRRVLVPA